ncbi:MAG: hypothetical protein U0350_33640 [Caldilineaceae bacterium]
MANLSLSPRHRRLWLAVLLAWLLAVGSGLTWGTPRWSPKPA